jgi:hypothetical protein
MKAGLGLLVAVGFAACRPAPSTTPPAEHGPAPLAPPPNHAPLDVPIVNASRGVSFLGARWTHVVWTGTEAVFFETTPGHLMSNLWVGRMDAQGHELSRVQVPLDHEVDVGSYPVWVDGTIAAVFSSYLTTHWIRVRPDGTLVADVKLAPKQGWTLYANSVAYADTGLAVVAGVDHGHAMVGPLGPFAIDTFDKQGRRLGSVELKDCGVAVAVAATRWGQVVICADDVPGNAPLQEFRDATTRLVAVRDGAIAWTHDVVFGSRISLGTDGERTLAVYEDNPEISHMVTDTLNGSDTSVRIELLDAAGKVLTSSAISSIAPNLRAQNLLWTGTEYAAVGLVFRLFRRPMTPGRRRSTS